VPEGDEFPQVTPSLLRKADALCRRRLAHEFRGGKRYGNKGADMRFAVSNRIEGDARLAQVEAGLPRREAFVDPSELEPEQQALYRAGVRGYLMAFGDTNARIADLGWRTALPDLGVDLVANVGIAAELADGRRELRKLQVGGRRTGQPILDDVDLRVLLVRTEEWAPTQLHIVAVDVIEQRSTLHTPDLVAARAEAHAWIAERVQQLFEHAADGRAKAGSDCQGCGFVNGCRAHAS
jgi:hypothetical protein